MKLKSPLLGSLQSGKESEDALLQASEDAKDPASEDGNNQASENEISQVVHTAAQQVLLTTELVEKILLHVPLKDLLFAQSVCMKWKAVIEGSTILQKALFFQPATTETALFHGECSGLSSRDEPLCNLGDHEDFFYLCPLDAVDLVQEFEKRRKTTFFILDSAHADLSRSSSLDNYKRMAQLNKHLRSKITKTRIFVNPLLLTQFRRFHDSFVLGHTHPEFLSYSLDFPECVLRPEASWRRMLVTQPPLGLVPIDTAQQLRREKLHGGRVGQPVYAERLLSVLDLWVERPVVVEGREEFEKWRSGADLAKIGRGSRSESEGEKLGEKLVDNVWW